jgi:RNA polymerase sigma-70 factor, ECF subfamily
MDDEDQQSTEDARRARRPCFSSLPGPMSNEFEQVLLHGQAAFPLIEVALAQRVRDEEPVAHRADLFLAMACVAGLPRATARFEVDVLHRVRRPIELALASNQHTDDLLQKVREKMFCTESKLRHYRGRGPLVAWTRAISVRLALELRGSGKGQVAEQLSERLPALSDDIELRFLYRTHRELFRTVLHDAFGSLTVRERTVLRLSLVDDVSLERVGRMYGVNKSSISRWVAQAKARVWHSVREQLAQRLQLQGSEAASLLKAVQSQLSISLFELGLDP